MLPAGTTVDLFCRVIDNYGDIGVCWRLARQLVAEHGCAVRLIVDDLHAFHYIAPAIDAEATTAQTLLSVGVVPWQHAEALAPAEVVIEAFACDPPARYVESMAAEQTKPVWLNLEYLSAETWVDDIHGRPSPHPRLPLVKYFFCPGFTERSGGLIREAQLLHAAARQPESQSGTLATESKPSAPTIPEPGFESPSLRLFAFAYPNAPLRAVADALAYAGHAVEVGAAAPFTDTDSAWPRLPPVPQPDFDALLARFDVLIVRGEDSFVRAQWAAKPLLWHIYPTDDAAHVAKLDAWLDHYCHGLPIDVSTAYRAACHAFVHGERHFAAYNGFVQQLPALASHALRWRDNLLRQTDLATRLVRFAALVKTQKVG